MVKAPRPANPPAHSSHHPGPGGSAGLAAARARQHGRGYEGSVHLCRTRTWNFKSRLLFRYALPAAANPLISLFGFSVGGLLSGSLLVEVVTGLARTRALAAGSNNVQRLVRRDRGGDVVNDFHDSRHFPGGRDARGGGSTGEDAIRK